MAYSENDSQAKSVGENTKRRLHDKTTVTDENRSFKIKSVKSMKKTKKQSLHLAPNNT